MNCMKGTEKIGKIVLSLDNKFILPEETLSHTLSEADGLDKESEIDLRILGCEIIQTIGILLKLPQVAMGTGQVLFQRFYYAASFVKRPMEVTAMACIYLASKIEEAPRRVRDIMNVFHHYKQKTLGKPVSPMILDTCYIMQKNMIIKLERRILKELGFAVHIKHPNKLIVVYLKLLEIDSTKCVQMAWNYMNDALRTDVFVRYQPETIACACIYLSARMLKVCLPESPPWFGLFQVPEADIKDVCFRLLHLYLRPKASSEKLLLKVAELERQKEYSRASSRLNDLDVDCSKDESKVDANGFHTKQTKSTDVISQVENITIGDSESNDREKRPKKSRRHRRDSKRYDRGLSPRRRKSSQRSVNGKDDGPRDYRSRSGDNPRRSDDRKERKHRKHYDDNEHYEKYTSSSSRHKRKRDR